MRILTLFLALLIACSPIDTNVPSSPQDLSLADLAGSPPPDLTISKLYYLSGSACVDASTPIPSFDFYSLVAVPPSTFAAETFNY